MILKGGKKSRACLDMRQKDESRVNQDNAMRRSLIITHGDVDGMVCAAQLIRREQSNCEQVFSNAKYVNRGN